MNVLLLNGSPHKAGGTFSAVRLTRSFRKTRLQRRLRRV